MNESFPDQKTSGTESDGTEVEKPPLDEVTLEALREAMDDEFDELVDAFVEDSNQLLADARGAAADNDPERLMLAAHSLKSSGGNFGAEPLARLAYALEEMGRAGDTEAAGPMLERLGAELARVQRALGA
ncbi:MAG: Hpt domain-containing protein [Gammaproteobacteria bacterium]